MAATPIPTGPMAALTAVAPSTDHGDRCKKRRPSPVQGPTQCRARHLFRQSRRVRDAASKAGWRRNARCRGCATSMVTPASRAATSCSRPWSSRTANASSGLQDGIASLQGRCRRSETITSGASAPAGQAAINKIDGRSAALYKQVPVVGFGPLLGRLPARLGGGGIRASAYRCPSARSDCRIRRAGQH